MTGARGPRPEPGPVHSARARAFLVVGMHRSGTSAVTRLLNFLGADLPTDLIPPLEGDNVTGFWEGREIARAHEALLESTGSSWHDVAPRDPSWFESDRVLQTEELLLEILERDFANSGSFAIKDPRICRLVPLWLRVLERYGAHCSFVMPVRNPLEVASSLNARNDFSPSKSLLLWLRHVVEAERDTRGHPRSWVSYSRLLDDWRGAVDRLRKELATTWTDVDLETASQIDGFLSRRHRHHETSWEELEARSDVVEWVRRAYTAATRSGDNAQLLTESFDKIAKELAVADQAFGPFLTEASLKAHAVSAQLSSEVTTLGEKLEAQSLELDELRRETSRLEDQLEREQQRLESANAAVARLAQSGGSAERAQAELEKRFQRERQRADTALASAAELKRSYEEEQERAESTAAALADIKDLLELERQRADSAVASIENVATRERQRAEAALASVAELNQELARSRGRADRAQAELGKVQGHLTAILSGRAFRYTRTLRRAWAWLKRQPAP